MKKSTLSNVLLISILVLSLIALGLLSNIANTQWSSYTISYNYLQSLAPSESIQYVGAQETVSSVYSSALQSTFILVFCALIAIASAVLLILLNRGGFAELKARMAQRKERVQADKTSRAELRKAKKIAKLEKQIEDLSTTEKK